MEKEDASGAISADVQSSLGEAQRIADMAGRPLSSADILLGMLRVGGVAARLLNERGITPGSVETALPQLSLDTCPGVGSLLRAAQEIAQGLAAPQVTSLHLLLSLLRDNGSAIELVRQTGNEPHKLRALVMRALTGPGPKFERREARPLATPVVTVPPAPIAPAKPMDTGGGPGKTPVTPARDTAPNRALPPNDLSTSDLLPLAPPNSPVLYRERELGRLLDILNTRAPRIIAIVGESGEGRSALLSALVTVGENAPLSPVGDFGSPPSLGGLFQAIHAAAPAGHPIVLEGSAWLGPEGSDGPLQLLATAAAGRKWILTLSPADLRRVELSLPALAEAIETVRLATPPTHHVLEMIELGLGNLLDSARVAIDEGLAPLLLRLSPHYPSERAQPGRAIAIAEIAVARAQRLGQARVTREDLAAVVADAAGLPVQQLLREDDERFRTLEDRLAARVVDHEEAQRKIASVLRRGYAGFRGRKPLASFLLLGPTGVGKTETARAIADALFDGQSSLLRIDLSEFSEPHSIARLIGAPPGYLGHEQGGQLTESIRRRPAQVVLLDELEKAHRDVLLLLLQVLEDGRLTDGRGHTVDFSSAVIVMTSNLGSECYRRTRAPAESTILALARNKLPQELWNRIDEVLCYSPLSEQSLATIVGRIAQASSLRLAAERNIKFQIDETVVQNILRVEPERSLGARPLRRAFERLIEGPIAAEIVAGRLSPGSEIEVHCSPDGQLEFTLLV